MTGGIARYALGGVTGAGVSVHPFATGDGLGLSLTRCRRAERDDVVLVVRGLASALDFRIRRRRARHD